MNEDKLSAERARAELIAERLTAKLKRGQPYSAKRAEHLKAHQWKKGQSGNPAGVWKKGQSGLDSLPTTTVKDRRLVRLGGETITKNLLREIKKHARGQAIARTLMKIATDKEHPLVVRAAEFIADRTEGKVAQQHEHKGVAIARLIVDTSGLTEQEVARIREMETPVLAERNGHAAQG